MLSPEAHDLRKVWWKARAYDVSGNPTRGCDRVGPAKGGRA
jgi:hypothetical protein